MASIHKLLNIVLPLTAIISILVILPPYLAFKLLSYIKRSMLTENVAGKVVFITGASSGIGEGLAYEYARRGATLALVARREDRLRVVADKARELGSPEVFVIRAGVAKVEECTRVECGSHIGITIVLPGLIESEITVPDSMSEFQAKFLPPFEPTKQWWRHVPDRAILVECSFYAQAATSRISRMVLSMEFYEWN